MSLPSPPTGLDLTETQVPRILGVNITLFVFAVTAVVLRFVCRRLVRTYLWWDDWLMVSALVNAAIINLVSITYMVHHGYGKHIWAGPPDAALAWAKGLFISEICYTCLICSIKFSLLTFYWRLFKQSKIRVPIYILGTIVTCWGIAVILISIFQCLPVSSFWNRFSPTDPVLGNCGVNVNKFFDGNSIPNIITDVAIIALPIPFVWKLHLPRAQKIALSSIFVLGIFVTGVSITRFTFIVNLNLASPDITWNFVNTQVWTGVESHVAIVCACLPSLRPLLSLLLTGSVHPTGASAASDSQRYASKHARPSYKLQYSSSSAEDDYNHLFVKHPNVEQHELTRTKISASVQPPAIARDALENHRTINVRTDLHVLNEAREGDV